MNVCLTWRTGGEDLLLTTPVGEKTAMGYYSRWIMESEGEIKGWDE